jgi:dUTP pyrophosphatase
MKVKYYIKKVDGLVIPTRANETDAGYDVTATSEPKIVGVKKEGTPFYEDVFYIEYETNLYITPASQHIYNTFGADDVHFHTDLKPRSSVSKYNLSLANSVGLIDRGYKHQVCARFNYLWQPRDFYTVHSQNLIPKDDATMIGQVTYGLVNDSKIYKKGDKIAQLQAVETHEIEFVLMDELPGDDRGGGFGTTEEKQKEAMIEMAKEGDKKEAEAFIEEVKKWV